MFENRFPSLSRHYSPTPLVEGVETATAFGTCEVVVFAQDASSSLGELPPERICLILEVWADRTRQLQEAGLAYVMPFEKRGIEMGATLQHPHGLEDARSQLKLLSSLSEDFQDQGVSRPAC